MARLAVILIGPPAAGKGTQAQMIGGALEFPIISTGNILREAVGNRTLLGMQAQEYMKAGALVPDDLVDAIVRERLRHGDCADGFILDGYPRTIGQAEALDAELRQEAAEILAIGIGVDDAILVKRIAGRRSCPKCGKVFSADLPPGSGELKCDHCGTPLVQRKDDTDEVLRERLEVYHRQTQPLIDYYKKRGCYVEVDGDRHVNDVSSSILGIVKGKK